jgi:3-phosphoshikimate 1-carboxyvinyltransferase
MTDLVVHPAERGLVGSVPVPSDKSIGHRALLLSAIATGTSTIHGFTGGADNASTLHALRELGVTIAESGPRTLRVEGVGLHGLRPPRVPLDCGNSGTTMRLLLGLLSAQPFESRLVGDASLSRRPMMRVVSPLRARGASIDGPRHATRADDVTAPLTVRPPPLATLGPLEHESAIASAQLKSALLLSGLTASGPTALKEPVVSRDHTERLLRAQGAPIAAMASWVLLDPSGWDGRLAPLDLEIPGDLSAAAFLVAAAHLVAGSRVSVRDVGLNPTRTGFLEIVRDMGGPLQVEMGEERGGEPTGALHATSGPLVGTRVGGERVTRAIDEVCVVSALAARASGETRIEGAGELRVKESDRLAMMATTLRAFGVPCDELEDGLVIAGTEGPLRGAVIDSGGDHRVAMTAAVLGLVAGSPTKVCDVDCIGTSFPKFIGTLRALGAHLDVVS